MTATFSRLAFLPDPRPAIRCAPWLVPAPLLNKMAQSTLNLLFNDALKNAELDFLHNRTVRITVSDMAIDLSITTNGRRLRVFTPDHTESVTLRAESGALLEIITSQTDPDTLFFHRRLGITGDTELGLQLKNFLDICEPAEIIPKPLYQVLTYCQTRQTLAAHSR